MKKKLLAGFLSLLMILTMTSSVLGASIMGFTQTMFDDCPECGHDYAVFYVDKGSLKYACPKCKATGYSYKGYDECFCGRHCDCLLTCDCGKQVVCGSICVGCSKYVECVEGCKTCPKATPCPTCKSTSCDCVIVCPDCKRVSECGQYCTGCGDLLLCSDKCTRCNVTSPDSFKCICGYSCDCKVNCPECKFSSGYCGEYCRYCGTELACKKDCKTCCSHNKWNYTVTIVQTLGGGYSLSGGKYGVKGETKTLTITPNYDYTIANVVINGVSYGGKYAKFELEMDRNYSIRITYKKVNTTILHTVTGESKGEGYIVFQKNGEKVDGPSVQMSYSDTLTCRFVPNDHYDIKDVKINGKSIGAKASYTFEDLRTNATVSVEFVWDSPYIDVDEAYESAVEYVTEAGIMSSFYTYIHKDEFMGDKLVSLRTLAAALAEMADTKGLLEKDADRIQWMTDLGVIEDESELKKIATAESACKLIAKFLDALEDKYDITFIGHKSSDSAKEICIALNLITEKAYDTNAKVTRYAMAEFCYAISNLDYAD